MDRKGSVSLAQSKKSDSPSSKVECQYASKPDGGVIDRVLLDLGSLDDTGEHLVDASLVESDQHFITGGNDRDRPSAGDLDHFFESLRIAAHIIIRELDALLRKILFRHFAVGSGGTAVYFDF